MNIKQRLSKLDWVVIAFIAIVLNLTTIADGDFPDYKLNIGLIIMILVVVFIYTTNNHD